ncbi:sulfotransferase [Candidatus Pacearchaeota archaeon]|nr:sulfotransferase [Candidatus Pacearchaeota archaeon]
MNQKPIFLCGPSRSGTAMLRSALNLHTAVRISGETHYFDDLRVVLKKKLKEKLSESDRKKIIDYFAALSHRPYGHGGDPARSTIDIGKYVSLADSSGGKADNFFQAYCELNAMTIGKTIWGEKTPRHIFRINEMLCAFPEAKVICMIRDPRAVTASYRDWKNQGGFDFEKDPGHYNALIVEQQRTKKSYHPATISLLWKAQMVAAIKAKKKWGMDKVRLQSYEQLVMNPEYELKDIAKWLAIPFQSEMLSVPMLNSSFSKFNVNQGISKEAIERWKEKLPLPEVQIVEKLCRRIMVKLGYENYAEKSGSVMAETILWFNWPLTVCRAARMNRKRSGGLLQYIWRRFKLIVS